MLTKNYKHHWEAEDAADKDKEAKMIDDWSKQIKESKPVYCARVFEASLWRYNMLVPDMDIDITP